ncbi:DUF3164 family protein [Thalassospira marina]|uniref:Sulfate transporter n=1 Tax=Thalassospira marina TaxID=2048283 RepID=A0A2N3KSH5_9PROT|nr:DUF3164 family protein [Thalassospira marina]PKR53539.1 sulfate transporter [Thalassospira marina]
MSIDIPKGFRKDKDGNLIADSNIRPVDLAADKVAVELCALAKGMQSTLAQFKAKAFELMLQHVDAVAANYDVKLGGDKGNVRIHSFDGRYRVDLAKADRIAFGPELEAARALLGEYLNEVTGGASNDLRTLVNRAFKVEDGRVSTADILGLLRINIEHDNWKRAMLAIRDSIQTIGTASYVRFYERDDKGHYNAIPLDIAKVSLEVKHSDGEAQ